MDVERRKTSYIDANDDEIYVTHKNVHEDDSSSTGQIVARIPPAQTSRSRCC